MTAEEYFNAVHDTTLQITEISEEIKQERMWLYNITGIDPEREKVTCGANHDLSQKIDTAWQSFYNAHKRLSRLFEIRQNCRLLIDGMVIGDRDRLSEARAVLKCWYLCGLSKKKIADILKMSHTQNAYRKRNEALLLFEQNYSKWLQSLKEVS